VSEATVIGDHPFLAGGGEMGDRIRRFDWAATSLGAPATWPAGLKTAAGLILSARQPMMIWWGEELIQIYNDGYAQILGPRHPAALGRPAPQSWGERWSLMEPAVSRAMAGEGGPIGETQDLAPLHEPGAPRGIGGVMAIRRPTPPPPSRAEAIIAAISKGCVVLDRDLIVTEINPAGLKMDGRPAAEIIGRRYSEAWPALVGTPLEAAYKQVRETSQPVYLQHHYVDATHDAWLDVRTYPAPDGVAFLFRDVTGAKQAADALRESESRLRLAQEAGVVGAYEWNLRTGELFASGVAKRLWGLAEDATLTIERAVAMIHPDDRVASMPRARRPLDELSGQAEYRIIRADTGEIRWMSRQVEIVRDEEGRPERAVGAITDITDRKRLMEHQQLLINELNHRVKNTLATVQSILNQTIRRGHSAEELQTLFTSRLLALSAAHDVLTRANWERAALCDIVAGATNPFEGPDRSRFATGGPHVLLAPNVALAIAMALHELATNAAKYGALSNGAGEVSLTWSLGAFEEPVLQLLWREQDGPPVTAPVNRGFGSRLLQQGLTAELGAPAELDFRPEGLVCRMRTYNILEAAT
jgi:PAS domain S-box-containing protein